METTQATAQCKLVPMQAAAAVVASNHVESLL
jgi:hypothetical protein